MTVWSRIAASMVRLPPPQTTDVSVERDLAAKMPDGAVLLADRWYPTEDPGSRPTVLIRTPYGRRVMGPLGRLYAERGYQTVIQSCRATFGSEGEWEPLRHEQADGHATLGWVASQPWFDGRLVMWGGSYLGGTQWAIAEDAPDFVRALGLQVTASNFRDAIVYPGGSFALEMAVAWLYQIKHQEQGWRTVLRTTLARRQGAGGRLRRAAPRQVRHRGHRRAGAAVPGLARAQRAGRPVVGPGQLRAPPRQGPTGQPRRRLVRPLPAGPGGRLRGAAPRRPRGAAHHRALDPRRAPASSPRRCATGPTGGRSASASSAGREPRAPVRVYVMGSRTWQEFSMWPPAGETQRWYLGRWGTLGTEPPAESAPDRYHYNPHDPTPAVGGATLNMGTSGRKDQRRREHRHDVLTYTSPVLTRGPHGDRPADRDALRPLLARAHRLRRAAVRRHREGQVLQPERRHRPACVPARCRRRRRRHACARDRDVADGQHLQSGPPHPPPGLERRPPAVLPQHGDRASRWRRAPPCARRTRRSSTTRCTRRASRCRSCA